MLKNTILKHIALTLALALLLPALFACSSVKPIKGTEEELAVIGMCAEEEVLYEELRLVTLTYQGILEAQYGEGIWDDPTTTAAHREELETAVLQNLTANYAVLSLCREYGISHTDKEIEEAVEEKLVDTVEELGGMSEYKSFLAENGLTDHLLRFSYAVNVCENELYITLTQHTSVIDTSDESMEAFLWGDDFIRTLHIFISNDEGEDREANRKKAEEALSKVKSGEIAFNTAIGRYSEDFYMTTADGYYFSRGEMIEPYEEAAFALAIDEVSEIIATDLGFFIIKRLEKETPYMMENFETLKSQCAAALFNEILAERQKELSITLNDYGKSLDLTTIR